MFYNELVGFGSKRYVQHLLRENAIYVCDAIVMNGAHVYVCGDVTMAADVLRTLQDMLQEYSAMSQEDVQKYILDMRVSFW